MIVGFFFSSRRRHTRWTGDWSSDVCSSDLNCHLTDKVASDRIQVGEQLAAMPASVEAMRAGEIGYGHLTVLARTAAAVGQRFDESRLLPLAKKHTPGKFYYKSLHYRHSIDARAYCEEQSEQEIYHHLSLSTSESGHLLING